MQVPGAEPFGFLVVDKPQGMTSHDVVAKVRRGIGVRRVGHAGTLDPMATGVLVVCIGAATRLSEYVMNSQKVYEARLRLGIETDTYDAEGKIVATYDTSHLTASLVEAALASFQGAVQQIPPMYSAIKQGGKKLFELARQDQDVERAPRTVHLETYVLNMALPNIDLMVGCSPGTYIRSIAHDLGALLGVGGHLTALRRMRSGTLHDPIGWDTLTTAMQDGTWRRYLIDEHIALANMPSLMLDSQQANDIVHGRVVPREANDENRMDTLPNLRRAYASGRFVAIVEGHAQHWKPVKVFAASEPTA